MGYEALIRGPQGTSPNPKQRKTAIFAATSSGALSMNGPSYCMAEPATMASASACWQPVRSNAALMRGSHGVKTG